MRSDVQQRRKPPTVNRAEALRSFGTCRKLVARTAIASAAAAATTAIFAWLGFVHV